MAAGAEGISSYAANSGFHRTRPLAAVPVGEGGLSSETVASVEAAAGVMEAIAIAAEATRLLVVAAARVYIDDVDPSFAELKPASARFDMKDGPECWGPVWSLAVRRSDEPHYSDPLPY